MSNLPSWYTSQTDMSSARRAPTVNVSQPAHPAYAVLSDANKKSKTLDPAKSQKAKEHQELLKVKKSWELALAPAKALPMNLVMSYMSGNSLQMVPITMTIMMFFLTPLKQIMATNQQFEHLVSKNNATDIFITKVLYILCHILSIGAGIWKLGQMGLLPNTRSDWLSFETPSTVIESSL